MTRCMLAVTVAALVLLSSAAAVAGPSVYGYIKLDASFDSAKTNDGNFAYIVLPYEEGEEDNEYNMTAKQTRLGMKFEAGDESEIDVSGRIEFDFYGGGGENKPNPMLRHAFMVMDFDAFQVLAGQTSDVISPLNPTTLNYIVLWKSGNIGYRRPQLRISRAMKLGETAKISLSASANRNMGMDGYGEDSGQPSFQGRLALATSMMGGNPVTLGVSGVYGTETDELGNEFDRTGVCIDAAIPMGDMFELKGEYFTGKNLAVHLGGVGQGIAIEPAPETREQEMSEVEASGWWAQLTVRPSEVVSVNLGAGSDDPELPDYAASDMIESNTTYYGNVIWSVTPSSYIGVEYMMLETEYVGTDEEPTGYEDNRVQLSFGYRF